MEEQARGQDIWICSACTFHNRDINRACAMCSQIRGFQNSDIMHFFSASRRLGSSSNSGIGMAMEGNAEQPTFSMCTVSRLVGGAVSRALTGVFAIVGAFTGAVTGALAGRATDSGLIRGAGLGAIAGAVLSVEFLEATRAYWQAEHSGSISAASLAEFVEEILSGRFLQEQVGPAILSGHHWQISIDSIRYEELSEWFSSAEEDQKGASENHLLALPWHFVTQNQEKFKDSNAEFLCPICLQEMQEGEKARSLPPCLHTFHMNCVDKWLCRHGSCPVCRQTIHQ